MPTLIRYLAITLLFACGAACGGTSDTSDGDGPVLPGVDPSSGVGDIVTLGDERFVVVRTLPPSALSAESLESVGEAAAPDGAPIPFARASDARVAPWELVSAADDGWRVWRPAIVADALSAAGPGASVVEAETMLWPDACLGAAEPGEVCAQVITPGYRIVIDVGGVRTLHHTDLRGNVRTPPATP